jgi:hypothetical protein
MNEAYFTRNNKGFQNYKVEKIMEASWTVELLLACWRMIDND